MQVRVSSLAQALSQAQGWADRVVSLVMPDEGLPDFRTWHLKVWMDDTTIPSDFWAPKLDDIKRVFDFCQKYDNVMIHCVGGISRSTAMGIGLLVRDGMPVSDATLLVADQRPNLAPNKLILQHIDTHLRLGGTLITQVQSVLDTLPKDLMLWCDKCKIHFVDGNNCPGGHWS